MPFREKVWLYKDEAPELTVAEAVTVVLADTSYVGTTEELRDALKNTMDMMGRLVQLLHDKGDITETEVAGLCGVLIEQYEQQA
jgi:hypothetical protein